MKENKNYLYKFLKIIVAFLIKIIFRPHVIGQENIPEQGPIILAGNHKHAIDSPLVMISNKRIVHYMAKEELFKGLHGEILKKIGTIKVNRGKSNPLAVIEAEKVLQNNGVVGIFPEGTRNRTEKELLKFRHGAVAIASKTNSKIIPFAIRGEYRIFRKGLELEFGTPIDINGMEIEEANKYLENEVLKLLRK